MVKIFVGNIPDDLYGNEIRELFESFGTVEEATRLSKFAFVVSYYILSCIQFNIIYYLYNRLVMYKLAFITIG